MPKSKETEPLEFALSMIRERERMNKQGIELPDWIDRDAWEGWVAKRRQMKNPVTERIARIAIRKLEQMRDEGYDPNQSLQEAEFRGWKGLFPVGEPKRKEWKSGSAQLSADDKDYYRKMGLIQ